MQKWAIASGLVLVNIGAYAAGYTEYQDQAQVRQGQCQQAPRQTQRQDQDQCQQAPRQTQRQDQGQCQQAPRQTQRQDQGQCQQTPRQDQGQCQQVQQADRAVQVVNLNAKEIHLSVAQRGNAPAAQAFELVRTATSPKTATLFIAYTQMKQVCTDSRFINRVLHCHHYEDQPVTKTQEVKVRFRHRNALDLKDAERFYLRLNQADVHAGKLKVEASQLAVREPYRVAVSQADSCSPARVTLWPATCSVGGFFTDLFAK